MRGLAQIAGGVHEGAGCARGSGGTKPALLVRYSCAVMELNAAQGLCENPGKVPSSASHGFVTTVSFDAQTSARTWNIDGHLGVVRSWSKHLTAFTFPKRPEPQMTAGCFLQHGEKLDVSLKARAVS